MTERRYRLAVDIGGTFVDAISYDEQTGEIAVRKAPTTPAAPADGVITATRATNASLEEASVYTHGTTLGLNAILERKGAVTGIITNAGFRDIFEIARGDLPQGSMYDFQYRRPELLVKRRHTVGVPGRIGPPGQGGDRTRPSGGDRGRSHAVRAGASSRWLSAFCTPMRTSNTRRPPRAS